MVASSLDSLDSSLKSKHKRGCSVPNEFWNHDLQTEARDLLRVKERKSPKELRHLRRKLSSTLNAVDGQQSNLAIMA